MESTEFREGQDPVPGNLGLLPPVNPHLCCNLRHERGIPDTAQCPENDKSRVKDKNYFFYSEGCRTASTGPSSFTSTSMPCLWISFSVFASMFVHLHEPGNRIRIPRTPGVWGESKKNIRRISAAQEFLCQSALQSYS
jgi:hypothetical protein